MAINQRYELLEVLRDDDGIRTAHGQDLTSGQVVEVHLFLNGHSMESKALLRKIVSMPRGGASALVDFGEEQGTPYVVTRALGSPFREWVVNETRRAQGFAPTPPPPPAPPPPPPSPSRDPFAHLFQPPTAAGAQGATPMFQPPPPSLPPMPQQKVASMGAVTVEFHRLFADDQNVATLRSAAPQPIPPPPAPPAAAPAGEFTLMFGEPRPNVPPVPPPPPPPAPPMKAPKAFELSLNPPVAPAPKLESPPPPQPPPDPVLGTFTQMFKSPVMPPAPAPPTPVPVNDFDKMFQPPLAPPAPPLARPTPAPANDFDKMFQPPAAPPPSPAPPPPAPEVGEFTRMFQAPTPPPAIIADLAKTIEKTPPPPAAGEFTNLFAAPTPPPMPAGTPTSNRMTVANQPPIPASAFAPPPPSPQSGMTVEFNRLFDEPKQTTKSSGMTVEFNRLFEPESKPIHTPTAKAPEVGEFTRMFQSGNPGPASPANPPPPQPPPSQPGSFTQMMNSMPPRPGVKPNSYITAREGESTQMFMAPQRSPQAPGTASGRMPSAPLPQPPPAGPNRPGEFTQMFQRQDNAPQPPPPHGEFTGLFQNPLASGQPSYMPALPQQPMGPPPPKPINEFEELFGGVKAQQQPSAFHPPQFGGAPPIPGANLSATNAFSAAPPPPAPYSSSPLAPAAGGGSYTQFMKAPGTPAALGLGQQAPKAPQPPPVIKKGIPTFVWIIGGVLIALLIATIAFFALRKH